MATGWSDIATAEAQDLLSVFLRPRGLVLSAVRLTEAAVSSSADPLGRNIPSMSLKPMGGGSPLHIWMSMLRKIVAPLVPAASQHAYGIPSGPGALCLALRRKVSISSMSVFWRGTNR